MEPKNELMQEEFLQNQEEGEIEELIIIDKGNNEKKRR